MEEDPGDADPQSVLWILFCDVILHAGLTDACQRLNVVSPELAVVLDGDAQLLSLTFAHFVPLF